MTPLCCTFVYEFPYRKETLLVAVCSNKVFMTSGHLLWATIISEKQCTVTSGQ
jgi:hypothetical protein